MIMAAANGHEEVVRLLAGAFNANADAQSVHVSTAAADRQGAHGRGD